MALGSQRGGAYDLTPRRPFARAAAELEREHARRKRSAIPTRPQSRRAVDTCARNEGGLSGYRWARLWAAVLKVVAPSQASRAVAAHLLTAGILTPKGCRATPELLLRSCSPKPSAERTRRAGAAWDVDQVHDRAWVECRAAHGGAHGCAHVLARARPRARQALRRRLSRPTAARPDRLEREIVTDSAKSVTGNREPPMKGGVHLRTAAVVEPAAGKRSTSAGWLVSASDVGAEGSETPRLQAAGKVPTVAALGSRAPRGAATKHTEQSTHQAAIWSALVYAGQCLAKGRKVTLTEESVTALRNLHTAPTDASNPQEDAARGETSAHPP